MGKHIWERSPKKNVFFLGNLSQIPRVFVRFGKTKGEIWVEKGDFRGDLFFFRGLDLVWESATPPTHIWERSPKKKVFFTPSLRAEWQDWIPPPSGRIGSVAFAVLLSSNMQKGEKMHILDDNLYFHICYSLADCFFGCLLKVICTLKKPLHHHDHIVIRIISTTTLQ